MPLSAEREREGEEGEGEEEIPLLIVPFIIYFIKFFLGVF